MAIPETVKITVAVDSGSVDNVINPGEVPDGVKVTPNAQGNHFVGANAGKCVVVPPGIVDRVLQFVKPLMQYDRKGGLHVAKMKLTDFQRPSGN